MVSNAKLYTQLDRLECELTERLVPHIDQAALGQNDLVFCVADFAPSEHAQIDMETEALVQLGRQILALREKLGESSAGTPAERLCWYCRQWGDAYRKNKQAARALAEAFRGEIT